MKSASLSNRIASRTRYMNMILLTVVLIPITIVTVQIDNGITSNASKNLARYSSIEAVEKLNSYMSRELALVQKVSYSKAVTAWFADENDPAKREAAYYEMMDYAAMLHSANLYFGINESLNEFSINYGASLDDFVPFDRLDPSVSYNDWYYQCITSRNEYTLNIDIDKVTQTRRLWINHKVKDETIVGVFCTGLHFDEIGHHLFSQYDGSTKGYVIDKHGIIQMSSGFEIVKEEDNETHINTVHNDPKFKTALNEYREKIDDYFNSNSESMVIKLGRGPYAYASISPISGTDWSIVTFFDSKSLFGITNLIPLMVVMLSALILYTFVSRLIMEKQVLTPLNQLIKSVSEAESAESRIYGNSRDDEIGDLARTIHEMRNRLSLYNIDFLRVNHELERHAQLLHAVNSAAVVMLSSADEEKFEALLHEGMELMAKCMVIDRIYIWKNETINGVLHYTQLFDWMNDLGRRSNPVPNKVSFPYTDIPEWLDLFQKGECVNGPVNDMPQHTQELLKPCKVRSLLQLPVFINGAFWGFVNFDDCHSDRIFNREEVNILHSASLMMVNAVNRHLQAAKIKEAHERVQLMLDSMPYVCTLFDKNMNCILCNEEAVNFFSLKSKQEYLDRFMEFSPEYQPDGELSADQFNVNIRKAFEYGKHVAEWTHELHDGTQVPVEVTFVRVNYDNEAVIASYMRDLRTHKQMMFDLEQRDIMLQTVNQVATVLFHSEVDAFAENLWSCMGMMASTVNADRVYIWENHVKDGKLYCTQLYEWSGGAEPQQGKANTEDLPYADLPGWEEKLSNWVCINDLIRNLSPREQNILSAQDILSILIVPVFLQGKFWGFVGFDDCHNERLFTLNEESILRSASLLIANALLRNEMTFSLRSNAVKLEAALKNAESASRAKTNFLSNMSHEIRTPMNAIIGMTSIGKSASNIDRKDYAFEKIENASTHLLGIINDILEMSKIEAGKFELSIMEFNLEKMLQKVVNVINFRIDEKHQKFIVYLDKNIPQFLIGDDQRLTQVLTNLLSNAVKFTPEEGTIHMGAHFLEEKNGVITLRFVVKDTGIGISEEQQARLFSSFEQAETSTSRKYGGTGLGLAISKHIVELMNGRIWIESELGKGATFAFTVQLEPGREKSVNLLLPGIDWSNVRLLAVDDEHDIREFFRDLAEQFNISCDTAASGEEALRLIAKNDPYNLFFIDWKMPGISGIELSQKIKTQYPGNSLIIMISSYEWNAIEKEAKAAGIDDFLPKPLLPSSVADYINKYIAAPDGRREKDAGGKQNISFAGHCILLAEDIEINREIIQAMMEPVELEIDCAENGKEALQMFSSQPDRYDLIFMDVQMPEMDGLEATRLIRSLNNPRAGKIPIIAMTANVFREDVERCLESGMNDHIGKPIDADELMKKLIIYLKPSASS